MAARLGAVFRRIVPLVPLVAAALALAACGSDGDDAGGDGGGGATTGVAARGHEVAQDSGCRGCHREGGGGIGPGWEGLYGSTVTLEDGSSVVADEDYLRRAITDPGAQVVDGFDIEMPEPDISDQDVADIIAYIQSVADAPESTS